MKKRVVFIDGRKGGDWSLDLVYAGLVKNLGIDNVIDYPAQDKHRMGVPKLTGDPERDWGLERMSLSYAPDYQRSKVWSQADVTHEIKKGRVDYIFVDERVESFELYCSLRAAFFNVPVIVVAGHDRFWNVSPEFVRQDYYKNNLKRMFLDNWKSEYNSLSYARNHNLSTNFDHLWDRYDINSSKEKIYDICFMGYNSHSNRSGAIDHILSKWGHLNNHIVLERRPDTFEQFVPKKQYFEAMVQSKICLNIRGAAESGKAMRFYEIPYAGSFMLSETWPGMYDQLHPMSCRYFSSLDELDEGIKWALEHPFEREVVAALAHSTAVYENSSTYRVKKMLEDIERG